MKRTLTILLVCSLLACKKSDEGASQINEALKGKWEFRYWSFDTNPVYMYPPGNGHYLVFDGTNFRNYDADTTYNSGTYTYLGKQSARTSTCIYPGGQDLLDKVKWNDPGGPYSIPEFFVISHDTLVFTSICSKNVPSNSVMWVKVQ